MFDRLIYGFDDDGDPMALPHWVKDDSPRCGCVKQPKTGVDVTLKNHHVGYSDTEFFRWRCNHCGAQFVTWIEG